MSLFFIFHLFVLWNKNNTDRNGVNTQNTNTKQPEKDNTSKGYLAW